MLVLQRKRAIRHVPRAPDTPPRYKPNTHSLSHTPLDFDSGMPHARLHSTLPHFHTPSRLSTSAHHHTHPHTHYTPSSHHTPHTEGDSAIHAVLRSASLSPQPHAHQMFTSHTHTQGGSKGAPRGSRGKRGKGGTIGDVSSRLFIHAALARDIGEARRLEAAAIEVQAPVKTTIFARVALALCRVSRGVAHQLAEVATAQSLAIKVTLGEQVGQRRGAERLPRHRDLQRRAGRDDGRRRVTIWRWRERR